jgi:ATP-dependent helicase C-terminal
VTGSLESFWRNGYGQMKKDLAGRYPRHRWPDPEELDFLPVPVEKAKGFFCNKTVAKSSVSV